MLLLCVDAVILVSYSSKNASETIVDETAFMIRHAMAASCFLATALTVHGRCQRPSRSLGPLGRETLVDRLKAPWQIP